MSVPKLAPKAFWTSADAETRERLAPTYCSHWKGFQHLQRSVWFLVSLVHSCSAHVSLVSCALFSHQHLLHSLKMHRGSVCFSSYARGHITKRKDETIHTTTWTTHHQTPQRSTTQHSTSWRSATDAMLPGHREHTGGSRQDTHGSPVLITIRRPWVAQPHEHAHAQATRDARHALPATMVLNTEMGGDLTAW